jgi:hypothetical protein
MWYDASEKRYSVCKCGKINIISLSHFGVKKNAWISQSSEICTDAPQYSGQTLGVYCAGHLKQKMSYKQ